MKKNKEIFMNINQDKITKVFMDMAALSTPSFHEAPILDFVEDYLKGRDVEISRLPFTHTNGLSSENMIIRLAADDSSKKGLFFDAHADTVCPCEDIKPILENGIVKSSGNSVLGADDKCGIASMLAAIDYILDNKIPHGELMFIVSAAEEGGLVGARYIPESEFKGMDYGIILDSGGPVGSVNLKAPFHYGYVIEVIGKAAHAAVAPDEGINAIKIAADVIEDLPTGNLGGAVANIGLIKGGSGRNVVPDHVEIIGEFRSLSDERCQPIKKQVEDAVAKHKSKAVDIKCDIVLGTVGYSFTPNDDIIKFVAAGLEALGIKPEYEESFGGTNANVYSQKGIQSTVISVGMEEIHSVNEYIRVQDLVDTAKLIIRLIESA